MYESRPSSAASASDHPQGLAALTLAITEDEVLVADGSGLPGCVDGEACRFARSCEGGLDVLVDPLASRSLDEHVEIEILLDQDQATLGTVLAVLDAIDAARLDEDWPAGLTLFVPEP